MISLNSQPTHLLPVDGSIFCLSLHTQHNMQQVNAERHTLNRNVRLVDVGSAPIEAR